MALIDDFLPALAFAAMLASEQNLSDTAYTTARADMDRLLDQAMASAIRHQPHQASNALFAVCAFADEAILASSWPGRHDWLRQKLQQVRFNTGNAGDEFYERLAALGRHLPPRDSTGPLMDRNADDEQREALEVYVACLSLGFSGRFYGGEEGRAKIGELTQANLERLLEQRGLAPGQIFPEPYSGSRLNFRRSRLLELLRLSLLLGLPALLALGLYVTFDALLSNFVNDWLRTLNGGG